MQQQKDKKDQSSSYQSQSKQSQSIDHVVKVGFAIFKPTTKLDQKIKTLLTKQWSHAILNQQQVQMDFQKNNSIILWQLFPHMIEFNIQKMSFSLYKQRENQLECQRLIHYTSSFLKSIEYIQFQELLYLDLSNIQLSNLEILSLLNCPKLDKLFIQRNKISRFNSFAKWSNKNLSILHIYQNPLITVESLTKIKANEIKDITLQYQNYLNSFNQNSHQMVVCEDLSILMKLNGQSIQELDISLSNRIFDKKRDKMNNKRFPKTINF